MNKVIILLIIIISINSCLIKQKESGNNLETLKKNVYRSVKLNDTTLHNLITNLKKQRYSIDREFFIYMDKFTSYKCDCYNDIKSKFENCYLYIYLSPNDTIISDESYYKFNFLKGFHNNLSKEEGIKYANLIYFKDNILFYKYLGIYEYAKKNGWEVNIPDNFEEYKDDAYIDFNKNTSSQAWKSSLGFMPQGIIKLKDIKNFYGEKVYFYESINLGNKSSSYLRMNSIIVSKKYGILGTSYQDQDDIRYNCIYESSSSDISYER